MKKYLMAIDAGTGSVRSVIFDESFKQIAVAQREWTHPENPQYAGAIDFDINTNTALLLDTIQSVIQKSGIDPKNIAGISTTSMREGFVLYNQSGKEIWAVSNVDARASQEVFDLKAMAEDMEEQIYLASGQTFALGAIPRLLWVKNNLPDIYKETTALTMFNDWIIYKLTGILSLEPSNGSTTGMVNAKTRDWDPAIIQKCGLKDGMYPPIYESGTPVGTVSKEIAALTGISEECIISTGGGDVQMGCVGVGAIEEGSAALLGGSFWQLEYNTATPNISPDCKIRVNCHAVPGLWQQELIAFFPGLVMRWFRDAFCEAEKEKAKTMGIDPYDLMNEQAKEVPIGSHGVFCSFSSVMDYKGWKHPSPCFTNFGIDPSIYNKATFYRSILENAALVTLGHKKMVEELVGSFPRSITFASGASKSALWCQIVADTLGVEVRVPKVREATALGAAFCAALGAELIPDLQTAVSQYVEFEKIYTPNEENHQAYELIYQQWLKVSKAQMDLSDAGPLQHMWRAPGI